MSRHLALRGRRDSSLFGAGAEVERVITSPQSSAFPRLSTAFVWIQVAASWLLSVLANACCLLGAIRVAGRELDSWVAPAFPHCLPETTGGSCGHSRSLFALRLPPCCTPHCPRWLRDVTVLLCWQSTTLVPEARARLELLRQQLSGPFKPPGHCGGHEDCSQ